MPKFTIRKVDGVKYAKKIIALQKATLSEDAPLSPKSGVWWLAFDEAGKAVGFASVRHSYKWPENCAYFQRCGVLPCARGHGLQKRFIKVRLAWCKRNSKNWSFTDTVLWNTHSSNNLSAAGFTLFTPEKPWAYRDSLYWRIKIE